MIDSLSSVEYALFAALARQERLHSLDARGRGAQLPVPLELVDVLAEDVAGAEGADEVVELAGLVAAATAARHAPVTVYAGKNMYCRKGRRADHAAGGTNSKGSEDGVRSVIEML